MRSENGRWREMTCHYPCRNKTEYGYCKTTGCINPKYDGRGGRMTEVKSLYDIGFEHGYAKAKEESEPIKHGRWLNEELFDRGIYFNTQGDCSECGHHGMTTNYCPNCGARMMDKPPAPDYTITCADAPMTYTSDCSRCANNTCKSVIKPTANCMGFREVK